jgi:two-component system, chemotaxis family, chemotaxis protein CheY
MKEYKISQVGTVNSASLQREPNPLPHILVVDDDIFIRQLSTEVLSDSGYHVDAAADGADAWEALQLKTFNLLITDNNMPRLTGVELVRKLRSASMELPVILATGGRIPTEELALNPSLQLAALLLKPFTINELLETVTKALPATDSSPWRLEPLPDWQSQPAGNIN